MRFRVGGSRLSNHTTGRKRLVRIRSEHALRLAAMENIGRRYPDRVVGSALPEAGAPWRLVFVPLYQRVPWGSKRKAMRMLKMTAHGWTENPRRFGEPWRPPTVNGRADDPVVAKQFQQSLNPNR
jgi:hypothetical protein